MKLFQLIFTLLATAVIVNAQLILGALALIEITVEIIEAAETVATLSLEAEAAITGTLEAEELAFTATITENDASLILPGRVTEATALEAEVGLPNFTPAGLNAASPIGSTAEWTQAFTLNGQQVSMDVVGSMQATASVAADGTFTLSAGELSGLFADFSIDSLSGSVTSSVVSFLASS